ncbi:MAG: 4a-hydroxytetrahydrobiopterin dehydratase [Myxococcota bacterium]
MARKKFEEAQIAAALAELSEWGRAGETISRTYTASSFRAAQRFVNRICDLAEGANHHPELEWTYTRVTVGFTTHDAGGLTSLDFRIAALVDEVFDAL